MSDGQYRALILLGVLLALEVLRSPNVQGFFKGILNTPLQNSTVSNAINTTTTTNTSSNPVVTKRGGNIR